MEFVDRQARYPNRVLITPENGSAAYYATMVRADEPIVVGTPINATTLNEIIATINYSPVLPATVE